MKKLIRIQGMTCGHCVMHVEEALKGICGVTSVNVDLVGKNAIVELAHHVDDAKIKDAIDDVGYEVVEIKEA